MNRHILAQHTHLRRSLGLAARAVGTSAELSGVALRTVDDVVNSTLEDHVHSQVTHSSGSQSSVSAAIGSSVLLEPTRAYYWTAEDAAGFSATQQGQEAHQASYSGLVQSDSLVENPELYIAEPPVPGGNWDELASNTGNAAAADAGFGSATELYAGLAAWDIHWRRYARGDTNLYSAAKGPAFEALRGVGAVPGAASPPAVASMVEDDVFAAAIRRGAMRKAEGNVAAAGVDDFKAPATPPQPSAELSQAAHAALDQYLVNAWKAAVRVDAAVTAGMTQAVQTGTEWRVPGQAELAAGTSTTDQDATSSSAAGESQPGRGASQQQQQQSTSDLFEGIPAAHAAAAGGKGASAAGEAEEDPLWGDTADATHITPGEESRYGLQPDPNFRPLVENSSDSDYYSDPEDAALWINHVRSHKASAARAATGELSGDEALPFMSGAGAQSDGEGGHGTEIDMSGKAMAERMGYAPGQDSPDDPMYWEQIATSMYGEGNWGPLLGMDNHEVLFFEPSIEDGAYRARRAAGAALREYKKLGERPNSRAYSKLHFRMLEAASRRNLEAMWMLWQAHRSGKDGVRVDYIAAQIMLDAAARARAPHVVAAVLEDLNSRQAALTPAIQRLLIKAAALLGNAELAQFTAKQYLEAGEPADSMVYSAVISSSAAAGQLDAAIEWHNRARRDDVPLPASQYGALMAAAGKAGAGEEAHFIWRALRTQRGLTVPSQVWQQVLQGLCDSAESNNAAADDVQAVLEAIAAGREGTGDIIAPARSLWTLFCATAEREQVDQAVAVMRMTRTHRAAPPADMRARIEAAMQTVRAAADAQLDHPGAPELRLTGAPYMPADLAEVDAARARAAAEAIGVGSMARMAQDGEAGFSDYPWVDPELEDSLAAADSMSERS